MLYTHYAPEKDNVGELWIMGVDGLVKEKVLGEGISVSDNRTVTMLPGGKGFVFEGWVKQEPGKISLLICRHLLST